MEELIPNFVSALCRELQLLSQARPKLSIHTVFFGGGTPSLLTPEQLETIMNVVATRFSLASDAEITLEANPNDVNKAYAGDLYHLGINRISLGMQSAQEKELRLFARRHGNTHLIRAITAIRQAGYENFNLDLIYGIPHQSIEDWQDSIQQAIRLHPSHLSLYALSLEKGTPLHGWVMNGQLPTPNDDTVAEMYELATDFLAAEGFLQYEISNWCKPGYESRHNLQYWRNLPYLACGPGAHGWANGIRYRNLRSPKQYIELLDGLNGQLPRAFPLSPAVEFHEKVTEQAEQAETLMMSLRLTQEGISLKQFQNRFGIDLLEERFEAIQRFSEMGLLDISDGALRLSREGRFVSNAILRDLV